MSRLFVEVFYFYEAVLIFGAETWRVTVITTRSIIINLSTVIQESLVFGGLKA